MLNVRPFFTLTDGNERAITSLGRIASIASLATRKRIEPKLLCAGRYAYLDLQPWAKEQAEAKDPAFARTFERFRLTLANLCDMASRNTLDRFTSTKAPSWMPQPSGVHPDGTTNPYMKPYVFEPVTVKIELTVCGAFDNIKRCFDDLNTMRDSETRFGRRIYHQMTGLHDEIKTLFDLYYQHRPSDEEYQRVADNLPYEGNRKFFAEQFTTSRHYDSTKEMVRNRLQQLLSSPVITRFLCRESTLDFEAAIDAGMVIVLTRPDTEMRSCSRD